MSFHDFENYIPSATGNSPSDNLSSTMATTENATTSQTSLLRKEMGLLDVVLFNIAAVLGPRWIARAAHSGQSSITLWIFAAIFFFLPMALVIAELSTRFPREGGLYVWTKEAFGDFHGFV